jgi:hypothetical protein
MSKYFSWSEVAVSAAKGAAVMTLLFSVAMGSALRDEPELPLLWLLLGCAAASYAICFVLVAALHGLVARQLERSGPPPTRFGVRRVRGLVVMLLISVAIGLCAGLLAQASRG